ncbi:MAG TPA: hypothetical protein VML50_13495 [Anaeromyxobacter sp.]|nr:hypothetical protein [Anaeromyxobacter sp.]
MPSAERSDRLAWLRSQGLGLACGFAVVVLLAVGSVVLAATREGASAAVGMDDLRGFFTPPSWVHLWLYLLFPVAGLYALNTALGTWDNVARRWRAGARTPSAYAAAVIHAGFLLGLAAHAVGGFLGEDRGEVVVSAGWQPLAGFGEVRLASLEVERLPSGMPRAARAGLEVRDEVGTVRPVTVGYNAPLATPGGGRLALLADLGELPLARLTSGAEGCALAQGQACRLGGERVELVALGPGPAALLRARGAAGGEELSWLGADGELALAGGRPVQLSGVERAPAIALRVRETPGTPWALAAALTLAAGIALLWRRLAP